MSASLSSSPDSSLRGPVPVAANAERPTEPEIVVPATGPSASPAGRAAPVGAEPLARIEDKASRIEEKLARSEASMQRVVDRFELASARMNEVALQADLTALRTEVAAVSRRVRRSAGPGALAVTAIATAVLSAVAVVLAMRYAPALIQR
jgi:hypothetical protein